jgi:hypothetical protein
MKLLDGLTTLVDPRRLKLCKFPCNKYPCWPHRFSGVSRVLTAKSSLGTPECSAVLALHGCHVSGKVRASVAQVPRFTPGEHVPLASIRLAHPAQLKPSSRQFLT